MCVHCSESLFTLDQSLNLQVLNYFGMHLFNVFPLPLAFIYYIYFFLVNLTFISSLPVNAWHIKILIGLQSDLGSYKSEQENISAVQEISVAKLSYSTTLADDHCSLECFLLTPVETMSHVCHL